MQRRASQCPHRDNRAGSRGRQGYPAQSVSKVEQLAPRHVTVVNHPSMLRDMLRDTFRSSHTQVRLVGGSRGQIAGFLGPSAHRSWGSVPSALHHSSLPASHAAHTSADRALKAGQSRPPPLLAASWPRSVLHCRQSTQGCPKPPTIAPCCQVAMQSARIPMEHAHAAPNACPIKKTSREHV